MVDLRSVQNKSLPYCKHCEEYLEKRLMDEEYLCLDCGVLHKKNYEQRQKTPRGCRSCEGTGEIIREKTRSICCEKPLEIGLCCQYYVLDIEKTPLKCETCEGTGKRKKSNV